VRVMVRDSDGVIHPARVLARNRLSDIAVLALDTPLAAAAWRAGPVGPGLPVCAIGNAFGLGLSVTCGRVSATHRAGIGFNAVEDFIQTDAAVNPGMSGGALVDEDGALVGMLSAIFTKQSDANIGVNFAVHLGLVHAVRSAAEAGHHLCRSRRVCWPVRCRQRARPDAKDYLLRGCWTVARALKPG
jgi:S1-C subfamily serine protease